MENFETDLRVHASALYGLLETMHAALGQPRLLGNASDALPAVITKTLENP